MDYFELKESIILLMKNKSLKVNIDFHNNLITFRNKDDVLSLLVHLGYLAYNSMTKSVYIFLIKNHIANFNML